jgi:Aldehyde dehydrogenase family
MDAGDNTPMSDSEIDQKLQRLAQQKHNWVAKPLAQRLELLWQIQKNLRIVSPRWVEATCYAKGLDPHAAIAGEEWLAGPFGVMHYIRLLIRSLKQVSQGTTIPSTKPGIATVFPNDLTDRLLWLGTRAEVWSQKTPITRRNPGSGCHEGQVALVLGAGNIAAIAPMDVLHQLFVENRVVLLKMNPVNAYLTPYLQKAFAPLLEKGFFEITAGGAEVGQSCCEHPEVAAIHITGSQHTYNAIAWGATPHGQQAEKVSGSPRLSKPITAELGGVTPILVVPGQWSEGDLQFQARHVASMVVHNASFNCVAGQALVLARGWPQRDAFLQCVRRELSIAPPRKAYYPGAFDRYQRFLMHYAQAEVLGQPVEGCIPWTLIPDIPAAPNEYALQEEAFCGVLAEVSVAASTPEDFLQTAIPFVNGHVFGTLSCTVLIDRRSQHLFRTGFEEAIAQLKYGSIGVNIWSGALFLMPEIPWGAFPGNLPEQIGSGVGFVHNTALIDAPLKAVVYAPFRIWPTPCWFVGHRTLAQVGQRLVQFESNPGWLPLLSTIAAALKG